MDGFLWLILSWLLVGIVCYLILNSMGASQTEAPVKHETSSTATASRLHGGEWINDIVAWLFTHMNRVPQPLTAWIDSLNEAAKKVSSPVSATDLYFNHFGGVIFT
ncbi:hypothetical protein AB6A40_007543 [Gnathostoma spinigerum]|uniref:ATP synthase F0 subunit 8 n=1 Tax=Gnathostoma spinigerum TaxID=75299 RepID=A0ABD6ELJ1_9BILA